MYCICLTDVVGPYRCMMASSAKGAMIPFNLLLHLLPYSEYDQQKGKASRMDGRNTENYVSVEQRAKYVARKEELYRHPLKMLMFAFQLHCYCVYYDCVSSFSTVY